MGWITRLIVKHYHELGNHNAGVNQSFVIEILDNYC